MVGWHKRRPRREPLDLPQDTEGMLSAYLAAKDPKARHFALERLVRAAPTRFKLKAWATKAEFAALAESKTAPKLKPAKALLKPEKGDAAAGHSLREYGSDDFDLATWARGRLAKLFAIKAKEMKRLLAAGHYRVALDALLHRKASGSVFKTAAKDQQFAAFCRKGFEAEAGLAKKAIMGHGWVFANRIPNDQKGLWGELSVSGVSTTKDRTRVVGLLIGGGSVTVDSADGFIDSSLMKHFVMRAIAGGDKMSTKRAARSAKKERARILSSLKAKYGWPDPIQRK